MIWASLFNNFYLYTGTYVSLYAYIIFSAVLGTLLAGIAYILSLSAAQDTERKSEYECGFEPFDSATRLPFDIHFYLVGILFLIFDVEVALLLPWMLGLKTSGWFGFYLVVGFILLLGVGFLYEWKRGALVWPVKQHSFPSSKFRRRYFRASSPLFAAMFETGNLPVTFTSVQNSQSFAWKLPVLSLLPEFILFLFILLAIVFVSVYWNQKEERKWLTAHAYTLVVAGLFASFCLCILSVVKEDNLFLFNENFVVNPYTNWLKALVALTGLVVLMYSKRYTYEEKGVFVEYPVVFALALLFMLILVSSNHLLISFLCIVGFSLNIYVLLTFNPNKLTAREVMVKYYYLSVISAGLMLYGIFIIFFIFRTLRFDELEHLSGCNYAAIYFNGWLLHYAFILLFGGLFFKLSSFPGHLWAADVYEGSHDPIVAFFLLPVKVATLIFTMQLLTAVFGSVSNIWQGLIVFTSVASLIWGCFGALCEINIKRFLAYTSINQMGFLLLGFTAVSNAGHLAAMQYLYIYVVMNIGFITVFLFFCFPSGANARYLTDFQSISRYQPVPGRFLTLIFFSAAGVPPFAGFFGKYAVLEALTMSGLYALVIIALTVSLISVYYYLRIIKLIWFETSGRRLSEDWEWNELWNTRGWQIVVIEYILWWLPTASGNSYEFLSYLINNAFF